jgi:hypothetical protein
MWARTPLIIADVTGLHSTAAVGFTGPSTKLGWPQVTVSYDLVGNRLLSDYVSEEINALSDYVNFHLVGSTQTTVSNNTAQKIVFTYSRVSNGVVAGGDVARAAAVSKSAINKTR